MTDRKILSMHIGLLASCLIMIFTSWIFVRFLHYHSQNRILNPKDYDVQVLSEDDYRKVTEQSNQEVTLSNGTIIRKTELELWHSKILPGYRAIKEHGPYVLVTIKGTAPFVRDWESTIIPLVVILIIALVLKLTDSQYKKSQ